MAQARVEDGWNCAQRALPWGWTLPRTTELKEYSIIKERPGAWGPSNSMIGARTGKPPWLQGGRLVGSVFSEECGYTIYSWIV
jgi:hypothetical protein